MVLFAGHSTISISPPGPEESLLWHGGKLILYFQN